MMLTEQEAMNKRCQESYGPQPAQTICNAPQPALMGGIGGLGYGVSTGYTQQSPWNCLGSACMAWRWKRNSVFVPDVEPNHFIEHEGKGDYSTTHGYCGKAGRP